LTDDGSQLFEQIGMMLSKQLDIFGHVFFDPSTNA